MAYESIRDTTSPLLPFLRIAPCSDSHSKVGFYLVAGSIYSFSATLVVESLLSWKELSQEFIWVNFLNARTPALRDWLAGYSRSVREPSGTLYGEKFLSITENCLPQMRCHPWIWRLLATCRQSARLVSLKLSKCSQELLALPHVLSGSAIRVQTVVCLRIRSAFTRFRNSSVGPKILRDLTLLSELNQMTYQSVSSTLQRQHELTMQNGTNSEISSDGCGPSDPKTLSLMSDQQTPSFKQRWGNRDPIRRQSRS